jgi:DNA invertase Pin-like site-specific DNA recombinase
VINKYQSNPTSKIFAYARVSTRMQKTDRQEVDLQEHGYDNIFIDKTSGSTTKRPALQDMISRLRAGDTVIVHSYDRLGRSTKDLFDLIELFKDKGVIFKSLKEDIDTSTAMGELYFTILSGIAQFERNRLRERTIEGLRASPNKGGRPKGQAKETQQKCLSAYNDYVNSGGKSIRQTLKENGISPRTYYKWYHLNKGKLKI